MTSYCTGEFHGAGGPIPVVRWSRAELSPLQEAFLQACLDAGYPLQADQNHPAGTGVNLMAMNRRGRVRRGIVQVATSPPTPTEPRPVTGGMTRA